MLSEHHCSPDLGSTETRLFRLLKVCQKNLLTPDFSHPKPLTVPRQRPKKTAFDAYRLMPFPKTRGTPEGRRKKNSGRPRWGPPGTCRNACTTMMQDIFVFLNREERDKDRVLNRRECQKRKGKGKNAGKQRGRPRERLQNGLNGGGGRAQGSTYPRHRIAYQSFVSQHAPPPRKKRKSKQSYEPRPREMDGVGGVGTRPTPTPLLSRLDAPLPMSGDRASCKYQPCDSWCLGWFGQGTSGIKKIKKRRGCWDGVDGSQSLS